MRYLVGAGLLLLTPILFAASAVVFGLLLATDLLHRNARWPD